MCPILAPVFVDFDEKKRTEYDTAASNLKAENPESEPNEFSCIKHCQKTYYFCKSPLVKCIYTQTAHLAFLLLFSYILLCDFNPVNSSGSNSNAGYLTIPVYEIVLITWVGALALEELRKV